MSRKAPIRFAHEGSDPTQYKKITSIGHSKIDRSKLYIQDVSTIEEYEHGCNIHDEDCPGHICRTPSGLLLPPQSMATRTNIMKNEIYAAAEHAFAPKSPYHQKQYEKKLYGMLKGKDGKMRSGVLTTPVDGSLRMPVIPHTYGDENDMYTCPVTDVILPACKAVFIPRYLSDKFRIIRVNKLTSRFVTECLKDGDGAYCIREPALHSGSTPLVRVFYWNKTAIGVHPILIKGLKGDYDGDELHIFPLYSDESIECVDSWTVAPHPDFCKANKIYNRYDFPDRHPGSMGFMWHTNFSFKELLNGKDPPLMSEYNRMSKEHINMLRQRSDPNETARTLIDTSIEGLNSINIQQHSQPIVGDMSRIARLACSSIKQLEDGTIYIASDKSMKCIYRSEPDTESGNSAVRAISRICATGQQAMLQAHKITKDKVPSHNMIQDMVSGLDFTVVLFDASVKLSYVTDFNTDKRVLWYPTIGKYKCLLCKPEIIDPVSVNSIVASYNPSVLSMIEESKRFNICKKGISMVFAQYSVPISVPELDSLTVAYTYMVSSKIYGSLAPEPITCRNGIAARNLNWFETAVATSYHELRNTVNNKDIEFQPVNTISGAIATCNFDLID